jgi:hypothetical protein
MSEFGKIRPRRQAPPRQSVRPHGRDPNRLQSARPDTVSTAAQPAAVDQPMTHSSRPPRSIAEALAGLQTLFASSRRPASELFPAEELQWSRDAIALLASRGLGEGDSACHAVEIVDKVMTSAPLEAQRRLAADVLAVHGLPHECWSVRVASVNALLHQAPRRQSTGCEISARATAQLIDAAAMTQDLSLARPAAKAAAHLIVVWGNETGMLARTVAHSERQSIRKCAST